MRVYTFRAPRDVESAIEQYVREMRAVGGVDVTATQAIQALIRAGAVARGVGGDNGS